MMDVLCRVGERLRIGDQVAIKIVAVEGMLVRLRISAAETTVVWRERSSQHQEDVEDFLHSE
jgi:carbon storage regulator CsrA